MTNLTSVAGDGTLAGRQAMAAAVLDHLRGERLVEPLREQGYEIGISCQETGIVASATAVESAHPTLNARVNVAQWWDAKELEEEEWVRQLSHALAVALRAAEKRSSAAKPERSRHGAEGAHPGRLRLRIPTLPGRGYRMA